MSKKDVLKYISSIEQIGGVRDFTFNDGKSKGVRAIEVNTGKLRFTIIPDRCMDIAQASYRGVSFGWMSKAAITAPTYYEKDGRSCLGGFYGGLMTTCGLKNIGRPYEEYGLHDRISYTPAKNVSVFADWIDDEYVMQISGEVRDSVAFGRNLVLKRKITAKLLENKFTIEDTIVNENFEDEEIALCYHCNFGYPLIKEGSKLINIPAEYSEIEPPQKGKEEACIELDIFEGDALVGVKNDDFGVYISYNTKNLPHFTLWQMFREGDYCIGLEPRTSNAGGENIRKRGEMVKLSSFEEYRTKITFEIKE